MKNLFKTFLLVAILFFSAQTIVTAQEVSEEEDITLEANVYSAEQYQEYLKENHLDIMGMKRLIQDSIQTKKHQIFIKSDDTFNYKLILEVYSKKGMITVFNIPFTNIFHEAKNIKKDLLTSTQKKEWTFSIPVSGKSFTKSDKLEIPDRKSDEIFVYTFTSKNAGKTWAVTKVVK